jgi:hypothetical protein
MTLLLLLIILLSYSQLLHSQSSSKPLRIEFPVIEDNQPYEVYPLGSNGVLLFYRASSSTDKTENRWILALFDINLKQKWTREFPLPDKFEYKFWHPYNDTVFIGFQDSGKKGDGKKASVIIVDVNTGFLKMDEENLPDKHDMFAGEIISGNIILAVKDKSDIATILLRDIPGTFHRSFDVEAEGRTFIEEIQPAPLGNGFILTYKVFRSKKESTYKLRQYDFNGKVMADLPFDLSADECTINSVKIHPLDSGKNLILGTYSNQKSINYSETENRLEESTGFFGGWSKNNLFSNHVLYNFLDFKNFFNRLRGNQSIYEGKNVKKDKELSSDYRLLLHDIIKRQNEYILTGEAYYPEYHTITNWTYDYYGHMIPNYYTVFDGYRYNNTFVCGFDSTGKMLWENSMEMSNILTMNLKQRVNLLFDGQEIILAYLTDGRIASKVINANQTLDGIEYSTIENFDSYDKVLENKDGILTYWYNNYLLAYGYQEIKNLTHSNTRRSVFYLCKIVFK